MRYDVIIIGGSVAGSTAATLLGRRGLRVLLLDRATFPRRKACGEGLSQLGFEIAARQHLLPPCGKGESYLPFEGFELTAGGRTRLLRHAHTSGVSVDRTTFDHYLWNQAASLASVTALAGSKVTSIDRSVGRTGKLSFSVVVGAQFFESKQLIVADGSNSATSKILGIPTVRTGPTRMGASAHFSGKFEVQPRYVKIFINRGCEFYVTPLSDGRLNLAVLARFDGDVDIAAVLQDLRLQRRIFSSMGFSGQIEAPPIGRSPLGNAHRSGLSAGVFLVGDAAEEFDPIGGMGMTHALLSAELAASHILATSTDQIQEIAANVVDYEQKRHAAAKVFRVFTRVSYSALRSAHLFPPMLDIATSRVGLALSAMLAPH